jgi:tetratricopeptide (TPR) repeat protein
MISLQPICQTALILASMVLPQPFAESGFSMHAFAAQADAPSAQLGRTRSQAESQHEIVVLLIKKKEFTQALTEANKIFDMRWPADQEPTFLKSLLLLSKEFLHAQQAPFGIKLLETNLRSFKNPASQAAIWKEKGYLYKNQGENDKALECFRQAQRLEK